MRRPSGVDGLAAARVLALLACCVAGCAIAQNVSIDGGGVALNMRRPPPPGANVLRSFVITGDGTKFVDPSFSDRLYPISMNGWWGFANERGYIVVYPQWHWCDYVYEGVYRIVFDGWTYHLRLLAKPLPREGSHADGTPRGFAYADRFSEGLAVVGGEGGHYLIDVSGRRVGDVTADLILRRSDGTSAALVDGRVGYLDRSGQWRIRPSFPVGRRFFDGRAAVRLSGGEPDAIGPWAVIDARGKTQWVDRSFRVQRLGDFRDGLMRVQVGDRWGYMDRSYRVAIEPRFLDARPFSGGRAAVRDDRGWYLIDRTGRAQRDGRLEDLFAFPFDARVGVAASEGRYGLVGRTQKWVVNPRYPWVYAEFRKLVRAGVDQPAGDFDYVSISGGRVFDVQQALRGITDTRTRTLSFSAVQSEVVVAPRVSAPIPRPAGGPPYPPEFLEDLQLPQPLLFEADPVTRLLRLDS